MPTGAAVPQHQQVMEQIRRNAAFLEAFSHHAQRAIIARAIAHPLRLALLAELAQKPCTQADLRTQLKPWVGAQTLGPHLAALKQVGLIKQSPRGRVYSLSHPLIHATIADLLGILWGFSHLAHRDEQALSASE